MKKLLVLVGILALVAAMVVPMAAFAAQEIQATGTMVAPTVSITAPGAISFGTFTPGWNPSPTTFKMASSWGYVTLTNNSDSGASFTLTAKSDGTTDGNFTLGEMYSNDTHNYLTEPMQVTFDTAGTAGFVASAPAFLPAAVHLTGSSSGNYSFGAAQNISAADGLIGPGTYYINIILSAQVNY
jgi:hypothetical protein